MRDIRTTEQGFQELESVLLRQMLESSGAFRGGEGAGGGIRSGLFIEALADAVAESGGLGLARMLEDTMPQTSETASGTTLPAKPPAAAAAEAAAAGVTSGYGVRQDPLDGSTRMHTGVDLRAAEGEPIHAAAAGVVKNAGRRGGYGNAIEIDHGGGLSTLYGHASELLVRDGQRVAAGQEIALAGHTGRATGPHLHLELRRDGRPMSPTKALIMYRASAEGASAGIPSAEAREQRP